MTKANLQYLIDTFGRENIKAFHYDNARFGHRNDGDMVTVLDMTKELVMDFVATAEVGREGPHIQLVVSDFEQIQNVEIDIKSKAALDALTVLSTDEKDALIEQFKKIGVTFK